MTDDYYYFVFIIIYCQYLLSKKKFLQNFFLVFLELKMSQNKLILPQLKLFS